MQANEFQEKIIGGNPVKIEDYPYTMVVKHHGKLACGGSILTTTRAITGAICFWRNVEASNYIILAGSTSLTGDANAQQRVLSRYHLHPMYSPGLYYQHNVAILFFEQPLVFGANVQAIALPPQNSSLPFDRKGVITGWGLTRNDQTAWNEQLMAVSIPFYIDVRKCDAYYGYHVVTGHMFCAGEPGSGRGSCGGDTGGPFAIDGQLLGINTLYTDCIGPNGPALFQRVSFFTDWIKEVMSSN